MIWRGRVVTGLGRCSREVEFPYGFHPGSLNLRPDDGEINLFASGKIPHRPPAGFHDSTWMPVITTAVFWPGETGTPTFVVVGLGNLDAVEVLWARHLRTYYGLSDDRLAVLKFHEVTP